MVEETRNESRARRYESTDAPAKLIVLFTVGLGLCLVAVLILLWFQYQSVMGVSPAARGNDASAWSYAARELTGIRDDKRQLEAEEARRLNSYEWIDAENGLARIPLDRAMQLLADQGLPQWDIEEERKNFIDMINEKARTQ